MDPLDPAFRAFLACAEMRAALEARDIATVYRLLGQAGLSQRQIAELTRQSQSEVSEILQGRQVHNVLLLERIADGLGVPRGWMRLGYGDDRPDAPSASAVQEVDEGVKRRTLISAFSVTTLGQAVQGVGELTEVALPNGQALPARLSLSHVTIVAAVTERLRGIARYYGGQADLFAAAVTLYTRWMAVPATDTVTAQLAAALAELHTEAGWCAHDSGLDGTGYFTRARRLAGEAGDAYGIANAAWHAGLTLVRSGHPNDALKLFQLGQFHLSGFSSSKPALADDPRIPILTARLHRQSATAYALLDNPNQAHRCLTEANNGWAPRDAYEQAGAELTTAGIQLDLHQLDTAAQLAANAVRTYRENHRQGRTTAQLLLAEVHIRAGEPDGLALAHHALTEVRTLQSVAARRERLLPLATALEAQPGTDTQELAQRARRIAATPI
ncbi:MAG: helix-turn-helix domain-containing protein [Actinomycetes bacterium]